MEQFLVGQNGMLSEAAAADQAAWYAEKYPSLDAIDFEAHIMLVRAYAALRTDAPFDRRHGLTKARYSVLRMLHSAEDNLMTMTDMVNGMNVSPTNITRLVDTLERDGYVRRVGDRRDKRKVGVQLLPAGAAVVDSTLPQVARHVTRLWSGLNRDEKRVLIHLLAKLRLDILTGAAERTVEDVGQQPPVIAAV